MARKQPALSLPAVRSPKLSKKPTRADDLIGLMVGICRLKAARWKMRDAEGDHTPDWSYWSTEFWQSTLGAAVVETGTNDLVELIGAAAAAPLVDRLGSEMDPCVRMSLEMRGKRVTRIDTHAYSAARMVELLKKGFRPTRPCWQDMCTMLQGYASFAMMQTACRAVVEEVEANPQPVDVLQRVSPKSVHPGCPLVGASVCSMMMTAMTVIRDVNQAAFTWQLTPSRLEMVMLAVRVWALLSEGVWSDQQGEGMLEWMGMQLGKVGTDHTSRASRLLGSGSV